MKQMICALVVSSLLFMACDKKEPQASTPGSLVTEAAKMITPRGAIVTDKPVKAGETGIFLPVGTKLVFSPDKLEVSTQLPEGYAFHANNLPFTQKSLPVFATYACYCSVLNSACQVFYDDGLGFGCLQSSCTGSCTGKFTYKGYSVDRIINLEDKGSFFSLPDVQEEIKRIARHVAATDKYSRFSVMGIDFFLVQDEKAFLEKASCDCEGTRACKLKVVPVNGDTSGKKIYYCEGACNGCELTVN